MSSQAGTFWRSAGMNYLTYLNICSSTVRRCLREPAKTKALDSRESLLFNFGRWKDHKTPVLRPVATVAAFQKILKE